MFEMFETLNKALENAFVELFFPYIYNWIPGFTGWDHFLQHSKEVKELIFETIHEHKKTRVVGRPRVYFSYIYTVWTINEGTEGSPQKVLPCLIKKALPITTKKALN